MHLSWQQIGPALALALENHVEILIERAWTLDESLGWFKGKSTGNHGF